MTFPEFIIVDDDAVNNFICRRVILTAFPYAGIKMFTGPKAAIQYFKTEFDYSLKTILFLDINMPRISGWDFLKILDGFDPSKTENLKVYMLSSSIDLNDRARSTGSKNVLNFISKPLTKEAVESTVNKLQEEERASISREIHDELGQQLMGIKMDLVWLSSKIRDPDALTKERIAGAVSLVDDTVETIRRINTGLRPHIIDDLGLIAAIEWQAIEFTSHTEIPCYFKSEMPEGEFSKPFSLNVYRIFQETLTNIGKYAKATEVISQIQYIGGVMKLSIKDNGCGFNTNIKRKRSFGLLGMAERAALLHGEIKIESIPKMGTTVELIVPIILKHL